MQERLYIIWKKEHDTGVSILDEQHRGLIATINSLYYFIQKGDGLEALEPTLNIMEAYMGFHLKTEEMILSQWDYPMIDEDAPSHKKTFLDFKSISREALAHSEPELLLRFLKNWWSMHIREQHAQYGQYLKNEVA